MLKLLAERREPTGVVHSFDKEREKRGDPPLRRGRGRDN